MRLIACAQSDFGPPGLWPGPCNFEFSGSPSFFTRAPAGMHPMRVWFTISIAAAAVLTSCTEGTVAPPDAGALETTPVSVRITADAGLSLLVGQSRALGARVSSAAGTSMPGAVVEWRSTHPQVAAVNAEGIVAALAPGRTLVIASLPPADLADTVAVDVAPIPVAAVSVTPAETSLPVGEALVFTVQATGPLGESLTGRTVAWSSSAPEVVTVDDGGSATLEAPGTATITAEVEGVRGSAIVTVEDTTTVVGAISLTPAVAQIVAGETVGFAAEALDLTGGAIPGMPMTWSSAAPGIASVDATGTVTGLLPGTTEIRARAGGVTGAAQITVTPPPPPTVASVSVTPASAVVPMGSARAFSAEARAADGTVLTGRATTWSSSAPAVASVDASGGAVGLTPGQTVVSATVEGVTGTATLTVTDTTTVVGSVQVAPGTATLQVGSGTGLTATVRDTSGVVVAGMPVTWSSAAPAVASVDAAGTVTALAAGTAEIRAHAGGVTGAAQITVTAPPPPPPPPGGTLTDECQTPGPGWVWCDDFDADRLSAYFEVNGGGGSFQRVAGVGSEGSTGMRAQWSVGQVSAGGLHLAVGRTPQAYMRPADAGTADYRELYWRVYVRHQPGWVGGGGDKLSRTFIFASPTSWAQAMIAHVWSGGQASNRDYLVIDPARGTDAAGNLRTTTYNDFANLSWLGSDRSATPIFDSAHVGSWYCVEARVRLNDAGQTNGVFQLWIDDVLEAERTGLNWVGAYSAYGLNAVYLENYWNSGSPVAQERYLDNFVVSTQRIGC